MRRLAIQPAARLDLLDIWDYIAANNIAAADKVYRAFEKAILELHRMPGIGHERSDLMDPKARFWNIYSYMIVFEYDEDTVTILRIIHGQRDIANWDDLS